MNATTKAVKGVAAEVRKDGFSWKAVVQHLGGGGTDYYRYNGGWQVWVQSDMPPRVYRALRAKVREAVAVALGVAQ